MEMDPFNRGIMVNVVRNNKGQIVKVGNAPRGKFPIAGAGIPRRRKR